MDEVPRPRGRSRRSYKIQEVIKRRQILLIQVVKEERGNKGAALTTYLSLAGRYCVLMPNTARGGGISRKIANQTARRKLKDIVSDLDVPQGMGVIVRTAGQSRTKSEIRRDFEYLLRLWDSVRDLTLDSTAPSVVYEEADLIKRAIRDMYAKDIDEILVDGEEGYRVAKDFMRMLMPSHAKKVQPYRERIPLLHRYQVEQQLDSMHSNVVQLKSGGYLVFAQTEALVAVDVNSGRSTKERNIEETALKTNLEAASEVGRQLRLRDLAGLVVIDYIDMDENRNNRAVERRMKDALKDDRARIQVGRISSFGLMELSRQRLRPSLFEASTKVCEICAGSGFVRTTESTALHVLRTIEEEGIRGRAAQLTVHAPADVALYLLNQKRDHLAEIEQRYGMGVHILGDDELVSPDCRVTIDRTRTAEEIEEIEAERRRTAALLSIPDDDDEAAADEAANAAEAPDGDDEDGEKAKERRPRRRRPRRRRGKSEDNGDGTEANADAGAGASAGADQGDGSENAEAEASKPADGTAADDGTEGEEKPARRRRGRRGGRRRRSNGDAAEASTETSTEPSEDAETATPGEASAPVVQVAPIGFTTSGITGATVTPEPVVDGEPIVA
ncbi:MAG: ribonuclease E/G, partial [Rhodospirillaceae bacterium]|nr:ribonuclease E/G [Rhodospirillaceae bacterium]MBT7976148.1 ribonuclease E/G [Rhodospirillaceae bacterium]